MGKGDFFNLNGKRIIISGASSGIGRQCAIRCAESGASLLLMGRDLGRLNETKQLCSKDTNIEIISFDLENGLPEIELNSFIKNKGRIDGFIHAAGISTTLPLRMVEAEKLNHFYKTNISPAILMTKWLCKPLNMNANGVSVVWLSSIMGLVGESGKSIYSLTKGALISGAKALAIELAQKKIRINCIAPGVVVTPMTNKAIYNQSDETRARIEALHPLGLGQPDDIAFAACYLLSDAARWVTGTVLTVDGGYSAR